MRIQLTWTEIEFLKHTILCLRRTASASVILFLTVWWAHLTVKCEMTWYLATDWVHTPTRNWTFYPNSLCRITAQLWTVQLHRRGNASSGITSSVFMICVLVGGIYQLSLESSLRGWIAANISNLLTINMKMHGNNHFIKTAKFASLNVELGTFRRNQNSMQQSILHELRYCWHKPQCWRMYSSQLLNTSYPRFLSTPRTTNGTLLIFL